MPADVMGKPAMFSTRKPGAGPKDKYFISQCTAAKPGKAEGTDWDSSLVDAWESNKGERTGVS